jgi:hypothetical protein
MIIDDRVVGRAMLDAGDWGERGAREVRGELWGVVSWGWELGVGSGRGWAGGSGQ